MSSWLNTCPTMRPRVFRDIPQNNVDKNVVIIPKQKIQSDINQYIIYISGGKLGDFIFQLAVIHANYIKTGKKGILYIGDIGDKFFKSINDTYNDTKDFILKQEYIEDYKIYNREEYNINLSSWRDIVFQNNYNWIELFKRKFNILFGLVKWINIEINDKLKNIILISHSLQRENTNINLKEVMFYMFRYE